MGIFNAIYNYLAQRNIGAWMGMRWNPEKDVRYQREMNLFSDNLAATQALQVTLPNAQEALQLNDYEKAYWSARRLLADLEGSSSPLAGEAMKEAQRILDIASPHVHPFDLDKSADDYFNEANALYQGLKSEKAHTKQSREDLARIVQLCQLAIEKDSHNGDAHVMLAAAYQMLALDGGPESALSVYCEGKAAAVIHHWNIARLYTRNQSIGQRVCDEILAHQAQKYPVLGPSKMADINNMMYFDAIDRRGFGKLEEILRERE